jgi:DNA polymerase III subunit delta'
MLLHPLIGHAEARQRLAKAVGAGRLPQVLLFTGPSGVGKQRLALWLAELLFCERSEAAPCGACRSCRLVQGLVHPDLHWFVPIARPKASEPDKQVAEAAEAIAQVMEERRAAPLYGPPDGMLGHGIASVRLLMRRAALTPVEAKRKVFILGDAERLVAQESSPEAANALLKLLEEPPADTTLILTAADARHLLPTVRSRAVPLRLGRLSNAQVETALREYLKPALSADELRTRVTVAEGSIGQAVAAGKAAGAAYEAAGALIEAVLEGRGARMERALAQPPFAARGEFTALLDALAETLGEAARGALGQAPRRPVPPALRRRANPEALVRAQERVAAARDAAAGNVNPQLLLAVLTDELAETL